MKLLSAFRPVDPGVDVTGDDDGNQPKRTGWLLLDLSREYANALLDVLTQYRDWKLAQQQLTNVAINMPDTGMLTLYEPGGDLSELWHAGRIGESRLARVPDVADPETIGTVRPPLNGMQVDVAVDDRGIWFQIFLPDVQFTVETAILTPELLEQAAGLVVPG